MSRDQRKAVHDPCRPDSDDSGCFSPLPSKVIEATDKFGTIILIPDMGFDIAL